MSDDAPSSTTPAPTQNDDIYASVLEVAKTEYAELRSAVTRANQLRLLIRALSALLDVDLDDEFQLYGSSRPSGSRQQRKSHPQKESTNGTVR